MDRMRAIARAVVTDCLRRQVVYVVLLFAAAMTAIIPSLPNYGLGMESGVFREFSLALVYVVAVVTALALAANRIPGEVERRTVYSILGKRVSRWEYVVGTWLGMFTVMAGLIAAFTLVIQAVAFFSYHDPMWVLWLGALALLLEIGVLLALAVAVSTRFGPVVVTVAALAGLFIGHSRSALTGGMGAVALKPFYPSLDAFNLVMPVSFGGGVAPVYVVAMLVTFVGMTGVLLTLGVLAFRGRDL